MSEKKTSREFRRALAQQVGVGKIAAIRACPRGEPLVFDILASEACHSTEEAAAVVRRLKQRASNARLWVGPLWADLALKSEFDGITGWEWMVTAYLDHRPIPPPIPL